MLGLGNVPLLENTTWTTTFFVPGDYFFDLIYTGLPEFPMLGREVYAQGIIATGGAMFITATSLHRLGVRVGWAACFGNVTTASTCAR